MATSKKVTRPLIHKIMQLTLELDAQEDAPSDEVALVEHLRRALHAEGIGLLPCATQVHCAPQGPDLMTCAVTLELSLVDITSGDEVRLSWAGQAVGKDDSLVERACAQALIGALRHTFSLTCPTRPEVAAEQPPAQEDTTHAATPAVHAPAPPKDDQEIVVHASDQADQADQADQETQTQSETEAQIEAQAEAQAEAETETEAGLDLGLEDEPEDEPIDAPIDAPVDEPASVLVATPDDALTQASAQATDAASSPDEAHEADHADVDDLDHNLAHEAQDIAQDIAQDAPLHDEDAPTPDYDEARHEPEADISFEQAREQLDEAIPRGFSEDPLWREYYEALLATVEDLDGGQGFMARLAAARGVEHVHWLSPEQLQLELDTIDELAGDEEYLANPSREPRAPSEQFMDALQRVIDGHWAMQFRALYLSRMGAPNLTSLEERKIQAMVKKLHKMHERERGDYIKKVVMEEA